MPEPRGNSSTPFGFGASGRAPFDIDPLFSRGAFGRPFVFTDPFELFRSLFGDIHNIHDDFDDFDDPFFGPRHSPFASPFSSPFGRLDLLGGFPFGGPPLLSGFGGSGMDGSNARSYSSVTQAIGQNGQWVSQSTMTRTINGRTERISKRRDAQVCRLPRFQLCRRVLTLPLG